MTARRRGRARRPRSSTTVAPRHRSCPWATSTAPASAPCCPASRPCSRWSTHAKKKQGWIMLYYRVLVRHASPSLSSNEASVVMSVCLSVCARSSPALLRSSLGDDSGRGYAPRPLLNLRTGITSSVVRQVKGEDRKLSVYTQRSHTAKSHTDVLHIFPSTFMHLNARAAQRHTSQIPPPGPHVPAEICVRSISTALGAALATRAVASSRHPAVRVPCTMPRAPSRPPPPVNIRAIAAYDQRNPGAAPPIHAVASDAVRCHRFPHPCATPPCSRAPHLRSASARPPHTTSGIHLHTVASDAFSGHRFHHHLGQRGGADAHSAPGAAERGRRTQRTREAERNG